MALTNNGSNNFPKKTICGVSVDIYSIVIPDLYDPTAIPNAWQKFWSQFPKDSSLDLSKAYGVSMPIAGSAGMLHYTAGVEVGADFQAPEEFELVTIDEGNYLELTHSGNISALAQSYGEAYGAVFPQSGLDMREGAHLEVYDSALNPNSDEYEMGILIPVK